VKGFFFAVSPHHAGYRAIPVFSVRQFVADFHFLSKAFSVGYYGSTTLPIQAADHCHFC